MLKGLAFALLCTSMLLGGCNGKDIQQGVLQTCGFYAKEKDLLKLAKTLGSSAVPGAAIPLDIAGAAVDKTCTAYNAAKAAPRRGGFNGVVVNGVFVGKAS
jgi:hypothetical protein